MARLTKEKRKQYSQWLAFQILIPGAFAGMTYFALRLFSVGDAFVESFAGADLLLMTGLIFLSLFDDLGKSTKGVKFGGIFPEFLPYLMLMVSLGLLLAYVVFKVRLAVSVSPIEVSGTSSNIYFTYVLSSVCV